MKKVLSLFLVVSLLFCFAACKEEDQGEMYYLHEITDGSETVTASQLAAELEAEGMKLNEVYWLKLYQDGSGVLHIREEESQMKWNATHIWSVDNENGKMTYTKDGDLLTIHDGDAVIVLRKN